MLRFTKRFNVYMQCMLFFKVTATVKDKIIVSSLAKVSSSVLIALIMNH